MPVTHGMRKSSEYVSWRAMKYRVLKPTSKDYHNYGGRGIKICERWMEFSNFIQDIGRKPSLGYTLDRIDPNGNYEPGNCRWADRTTQGINKRGLPSTNTTGHLGVVKDKDVWVAQLKIKGKYYYLGRYKDLNKAIEARKQAEQKYHAPYLQI